MSLIQCPECGKTVSNRAQACIHCGFPILSISSEYSSPNVKCLIDIGYYKKEFDFSDLINEISSYGDISQNDKSKLTHKLFCMVGGILNSNDCETLINQIIVSHEVPRYFARSQNSNASSCPKCGSTSITTGARGVNFTFGLIGAAKTVNRCGRCGYTWKPKL